MALTARTGLSCPVRKGVWAAIVISLLPAGVRGLADDTDTVRSRLAALYSGEAAHQTGKFYAAAMTDLNQRVGVLINDPAAWPDMDNAKPELRGVEVAKHYVNILTMAQAYRARGSANRESDTLKNRIEAEMKKGLRWTAPGTARPGNWYQWLISIPQALGPALIRLEGKIDQALFDQNLKAMVDLTKEPGLSGANAVWEGRNHFYLGLLQHDKKRVALGLKVLEREITVGEGGGGILEDYSFQFHGRLLHTSGYGSGYAYSIAEIMYLCEGTRWEIADERCQLLKRHLIEHARWTIWHGVYDLSVRGRGVLRASGETPHLDAMLLLGAGKGAERDDCRHAALVMMTQGDAHPTLLTAGLADELGEGKPVPLTGFRHFYATDFAAFRRSDFYASVRMYSDRLIDYEGNWDQNLSGWFLCYGLTYFSRSGDELWRDGAIQSQDFDWDRLPGTTARVGVHPAKAYNLGTSSFAGGAGGETNESGGVCGFILKPAAGDFVARKSYFFFTNGFAALGSGITSSAVRAEPVVTTITQWSAATGGIPLMLSGDRTIDAIDGDASWSNVQWAWYDGVGYLFLEPVTLRGHRRGKLVTLWMDHGNKPKDAKYAYVVLPAATQGETARLSRVPPVRILGQDEKSHTVEDVGNGSIGAVYWKEGQASGTTVDAPAVIYIEPRGSGRVVSVSNPLHTAANLSVSLVGELPTASARPDEVTVEQKRDGSRLSIQTDNGRIYRVGFGAANVQQQPREDVIARSGFRTEAATKWTALGSTITITATFPKSVEPEGQRLFIRGPQGHLRKELTDADVIDRPAANVARYRWTRRGDLNKPKEREFFAQFYTGLYQFGSPFTIELPLPPAAKPSP